MKKTSILLSSLIILTACGGGNGGSGTGIIDKPDTPFVPQEDTIASSNAKITNMVSNSEYQVALFVSNKLGTDAESVGLGDIASRSVTTRGAFVPNVSGSLYYDKAAELVDMAKWLNQSDTSEGDIIAEFNKDKNKIKAALKLMDDMYCFVGGDAAETARRILEIRNAHSFDEPLQDLVSKTEVFNLKDVVFDTTAAGRITKLIFNVNKKTGKIESIEYPEAQAIMDEAANNNNDYTSIAIGPMERDGDTAFFVEHDYYEDGTPVEIKHEYISYARELGLKYSDFGVLKVDFSDIEGAEQFGVSYDPFAGGYTTKAVDNGRMKELAQNNEMKFTGLAKGTLTRFWIDENGQNYDIPIDENGLKDEAATLVFAADGTQTLSANFDNWYDVQMIKNDDGTNQFKVVGGTGGTDSRFHIQPEEGVKLPEHMIVGTNNGTTNERMEFVTGYYGDKGIPSEATGIVKYTFNPHPFEEDNPIGNINFMLGFGGTKQ